MSFSNPQIIQHGNTYTVQHGSDAGLFVQFYFESIKNEEKSIELGRNVFEDREFIKIIPVGDKNTVVCEPVTDDHRARWPVQYTAFKNQKVQAVEGTPLEEWPVLSKSQVLNYKSVNVHTVEQLSEVSDNNLTNLGIGARENREKAKAFLENAKDGAALNKAMAKIDELEKQIQALKNQNSGFDLNKKSKSKKGEVNGEDVS